jgi:myo-inositol-1(or 4)-monophosphatase
LSAADPHALLDLAVRASHAAGALLVERSHRAASGLDYKSSLTDPVSDADRDAETLIVGLLRGERPGDGVLGEEGAGAAGASGLEWVVDPLDGTVNYLYGIPAYAVSVAAVSGPPDPAGWTVLAACVHSVTDGRTWTAARGRGAHLDGVRCAVNAHVPLAQSLLGTGFGYVAERRRAQAAVLATVLPQVRDIRRIGSAALDLCTIASGGLDLYYERGLKPWDLAAASLVAAEAGASVVGLHGAPAGEAMTVAGHPRGVAALVPVLEALRADTDEVPDPPR